MAKEIKGKKQHNCNKGTGIHNRLDPEELQKILDEMESSESSAKTEDDYTQQEQEQHPTKWYHKRGFKIAKELGLTILATTGLVVSTLITIKAGRGIHNSHSKGGE